MKASPALLVTCAALALGACAAKSPPARTQVDTARIVDAIKTDEVHWNSDYKSGDAGLLARHYAADATLMIPGAAPLVGTAAIRAALGQALEDKAFTLTFASDKVDVSASGDMAAARGSYTQTATDPKTNAVVTEKGSYVTLYRPQSDGVWKAIWDINAPGAPVAQPSGAQ